MINIIGGCGWTAIYYTLLLTLYRFMPELIFEGIMHIAMPPFIKAMPKGNEAILI